MTAMADNPNPNSVEITDDDLRLGPVEVHLDDAPAQDKGAKPQQQPSKQQAAPAEEDEGIASLKRQIEEEKRRRAEANRLAEEQRQRAERETQARVAAEEEAKSSRRDTVANAIDAETMALDSAKAQFKGAMEAADFAKAAEAQTAISRATTRLERLNESKASFESAKTVEGRVAPRQEPVNQDPVEAFASRLTPASAAWIRSHRDCVTDPVLNAEMIAAHQWAFRKGIAADSPEYFRFIEERLGYQQENSQVNAPSRQEPVRQQQPRTASNGQPIAPVTRSANPMNGARRPSSYTLSPDEREICDSNGWDYKEYALNKLALIDEGRLPN